MNKNPKKPISDEEGFKIYGDRWLDPLFRQEITGIPFDIDAHMNDGELKYSGEDKLGQDAKKVWWKRNIEGQGHPEENNYLNSIGKRGKER